MTGFKLLLHQFKFDQKLFWRSPPTVFFSVALPLVFLFLLGAVFGDAAERDEKYGLLADEYLVPAIMTLGIVSATFVNIAMVVTYNREMGVLKRLRGTPLPTWALVGARTVTAVVNAALIATVILVAGKVAYGVDVTATRLAGMAIATVVGAVSFSALGFAVTVVIPSQAAATAITNMIVLPLYFVSGVFGSVDDLPEGLAAVGEFFPISHLGACLFETFSPDATGIGLPLADLAIVIAWGLFGLVFAALRFDWEPHEGR
ncbi:MAG: ABC transporter permease [Actinobacteria bacterium]|nr:ABC transporter permease [Actinomycetota bacterium]